MAERTEAWKKEDNLRKIAMYAHTNCKSRSGVLVIRPGQLSVPKNAPAAEIRCEYFKADRLVSCLCPPDEELRKKRPKYLESIIDAEEANKVARVLLEGNDFYVRTNKPMKQKGDHPDVLDLARENRWDDVKAYVKGDRQEANYYAWITEGDQTTSTLVSGIMIGLFLLITCFPIWPHFFKLGVWYLCVTLLLIITGFLLVRMFLFLFIWIFGFEFWIFPNMFDESLTVVESFRPTLSFDRTPPGQMWWRMIVLACFGIVTYWAFTQPTDFDEFIKSNQQFVDDLYEGNLLSDVSQQSKDDIDKLKVPTIEDLLSDLEEPQEERAENENFLDETDPMEVEADVDSMLDSLFESENFEEESYEYEE